MHVTNNIRVIGKLRETVFRARPTTEYSLSAMHGFYRISDSIISEFDRISLSVTPLQLVASV